jgi:hypothetical protein
MWVEELKACDDDSAEFDEVECKTADATMLEEGTKHDRIRRYNNEFDKTKGDARADPFNLNARVRLLAIAEPHVIVRTKQSRKDFL